MRVTMSAFTAVIALLPLEAGYAQSTQCRWIGNVWNCDQRPGVDWGVLSRPQNPGVDWNAINRQQAQNEQLRQQQKALDAAERTRNLRAEVGQMVADGRCEDAKKAALQAGEFDLAERAVALCKP